MEAKESGLFAEGFFTAFTLKRFFLSEDGCIVGRAMFNQMVDDAGELVGRCRDRGWGTQASFHPTKEVAKSALAALEALSCHPQGRGGATFDIAGGGGEDASAGNSVVRTKAQPGGKAFGTGKAFDAGADFAQEGADRGALQAGHLGQIDAEDSIQFPPQIEGGFMALWATMAGGRLR